MTRDHDTDPNSLTGTDPNYPPLPVGDRSSYGKLNYGPQMRSETDPNFLTPPGGMAVTDSDAPFSDEPPSSSDASADDAIDSGPNSGGALRARHQAAARRLRAGNNDTQKMVSPVMLNETVPLADALVAPEVIERRQRNQRKMRRDEATQVNDAGKRKSEKRLLTAAAWGIFAAALVIAFCEFALK
ncbi:MAG: hypothetical protein ABI461_23645 [Polyangiaceae bacterium]